MTPHSTRPPYPANNGDAQAVDAREVLDTELPRYDEALRRLGE